MTFKERKHPRPRLEGDTYVGTRQAVGALCNRHPAVVSKFCQPIGCDVKTQLPLYDIMACNVALKTVPRRTKRHSDRKEGAGR